MKELLKTIKALAACEDGASAMEYALLTAAIALGTYAAVSTFGTTMSNDFFGALGLAMGGLDTSLTSGE